MTWVDSTSPAFRVLDVRKLTVSVLYCTRPNNSSLYIYIFSSVGNTFHWLYIIIIIVNIEKVYHLSMNGLTSRTILHNRHASKGQMAVSSLNVHWFQFSSALNPELSGTSVVFRYFGRWSGL